MEITSRDNENFKQLQKLTQKKFRRQFGLCIAEGEKIVREHLGNASRVFIRKSCADRYSELYRQVPDSMRFILSDSLFDLISSLETDRGILAVVPIPDAGAVTFPYLVLDGIADSGNMGTLLRTAAAFGFCTVFCLNCVDAFSQKVIRAASGMQFNLNIIETDCDGFADYFNNKLTGSVLVLADMRGDTVGFKDNGKFGLVLGNEGQGISSQLRTLPHRTASVPMKEGCESLNVAVAGGILMYLFQKNCLTVPD